MSGSGTRSAVPIIEENENASDRSFGGRGKEHAGTRLAGAIKRAPREAQHLRLEAGGFP